MMVWRVGGFRLVKPPGFACPSEWESQVRGSRARRERRENGETYFRRERSGRIYAGCVGAGFEAGFFRIDFTRRRTC